MECQECGSDKNLIEISGDGIYCISCAYDLAQDILTGLNLEDPMTLISLMFGEFNVEKL